MTDRLLRALECPHLRILGHPTGRLLLQREPYPFDFDRVAAEAVRRGVWLEINASPERLDLHGPLIRTAKAKGARFTISTDAHHPKHLAGMRYGVVTARRGWLGPGGHHEHAAGGPVRRGAPRQDHENHRIEAKSTTASCSGSRRTRPSIRRPDSKSAARWCATPVRPS